jgi:RND family efflux transporter MFP subunit
MKASFPGKSSLPLIIAALAGILLLGSVAVLTQRSGRARMRAPGLIERVFEREGTADNDRDRDQDAGGDRERPSAPAPPGRPAGGNEDADREKAMPGTHATGAGEPGVVRFEGQGLKLAHLRIETVGYRSVRSRLPVTGTVEANPAGMVQVTPRAAGKLTAIRVTVGDSVRAGEILATEASTDLAQAQAAYRQAAARGAVAGNNLQRQRQLARLGAFARPSLEAARNQAATAQAEARTAQADVATAQADISQAESELQVLRTALEQARTQAGVSQSRFNRADLLLKEELVSRQDWEQARADDQKARADIAAARAKIAQGQAGIETARANLQTAQAKLAAARKRSQIATQALAREQSVYQGGYATSKEIVAAEADLRQARLEQRAAGDNIRLLGGIPGGSDQIPLRAPLTGHVTERFVTAGEMVTPDKTLFTILNLHTVWVQLNVYPKDVPAVRAGQAVTVASDTAPGYTFSGTVSYISDVVEPATRTVRVRCVIRNRRDLLKPGAFVRGNIAAHPEDRAPALIVPKDAVQQMGGRPVVFMPAGKPDEFRAHPVEVGQSFGTLVEIRSGLRPGDRIVTRNAFLVKAQAMKGELGEEDGEKEKGER